MDPNATDTYAYRHLHVAGRGGRRADSNKGSGGGAGFVDKRPNTSHEAQKNRPAALPAEPLPPKPHTAHATKRTADVLPGGKDVTLGAQIEKERAAAAAAATAAAAAATAAAAAAAAAKSPKKTKNAAKASNEASRGAAEAKIAAFRFGRLDGRPALLAYFVFTYFHPLPEYCKIVQELETPTKQRGTVSCLGLAREDVDRQGRRIQARRVTPLVLSSTHPLILSCMPFAFGPAVDEPWCPFSLASLFKRPPFLTPASPISQHPPVRPSHAPPSPPQAFCHHRWGMRLMNRYLESRYAAKRDRKKYDAATTIQRRIRGLLGRRKGLRAAQEMYRKFIDLEYGEPYWFNTRSKASFWTKPPLLRHLDCGFPVQLAHPDEQVRFCCPAWDTPIPARPGTLTPSPGEQVRAFPARAQADRQKAALQGLSFYFPP